MSGPWGREGFLWAPRGPHVQYLWREKVCHVSGGEEGWSALCIVWSPRVRRPEATVEPEGKKLDVRVSGGGNRSDSRVGCESEGKCMRRLTQSARQTAWQVVVCSDECRDYAESQRMNETNVVYSVVISETVGRSEIL